MDGAGVGDGVTDSVGFCSEVVGTAVGDGVGDRVGAGVGSEVVGGDGASVGVGVGAADGNAVWNSTISPELHETPLLLEKRPAPDIGVE